ncbi:DUF3592 domain-containing protein [Kangiella koreensis]|uniref:DUF3592 domain-containing protein n=1 Tax=Kangiella koreensis (strain DSM 16069 / JCM 12317 / KCTC 12182 / SW-125) TaxID=523791 RepID=C7RAY1_KANKD|nr:DUF3592 domain-containing protein [Kangiella koreensis]ACV26423.1 hypothetical protein Kkor_1003 [Kangiella koreensis DSM 16069]
MSIEELAAVFGIGIFLLVSVFALRLMANFLKKPAKAFKEYADESLNNYKHWQRTTGFIQSTEVKTEHSPSNTISITSYKPHIEYTYEIDGKSYHGQQLALVLINQSTHKEAEEFLQQYQVGKPVIIYYDPDAPHASSIFIKLSIPLNKQKRGPLYFDGVLKDK